MSEEHWMELGVQFDDADIIECADDAEARAVADRHGGTLVKRHVFGTSWANPPTDVQ